MKESKFIVGKNYRYSDIPTEESKEFIVYEYGEDYIGQNAIHIRFHKSETDVWLIWDGMANEGIFKCVYVK